MKVARVVSVILSPVLQSARPACISARVLGPMSSPIHPAGIEFTSTTWKLKKDYLKKRYDSMKGWRMGVKNTQVKVYRWEATKGTVRDRKIT